MIRLSLIWKKQKKDTIHKHKYVLVVLSELENAHYGHSTIVQLYSIKGSTQDYSLNYISETHKKCSMVCGTPTLWYAIQSNKGIVRSF